MPSYSSTAALFPGTLAATLPITTAHDDATDRDAVAPEMVAGAHMQRLANEIRAVQAYVLAVAGLQVTDSSGITVAYSAGRIRVGDGAPVDVAASTLVLTDDDTNYVECSAAGVVSANVVGFTDDTLPLATVVCASADISSVTDDRTAYYLADPSEMGLDDLGDVVITAVADNELLAWDAGTSKFINQTSTEAGFGALALLAAVASIDDITDVAITGVADGDALVWDSGAGKWVNEVAASAAVNERLAVLEDNVLLNAFRNAINGGLVWLNMEDAIVDEFEDESGVDTTTSTNEVYDAINDLYSNTADMVLVSETVTAEALPTTARIVLFEENVDAVTINTDLKAYLSRDGGTTWDQVPLVDEGDYASSKQILAGTVTLTGETGGGYGHGMSMQWKVTTHNSKDIKLHGVGVLWR